MTLARVLARTAFVALLAAACLSLPTALLAGDDEPKEITIDWIGKDAVLKLDVGEFDYEYFSKTPLGLGAYKTLVVAEFQMTAELPEDEKDEDDQDDIRWADAGKEFQKQLVEAITKTNTKSGTFGEVKAGAKDDAAADLVLEGRVTELNRGSRAARYFVGFGAGSGYIKVEARLTDKTGKVVYALAHRQLAVLVTTDLRDEMRDFSKEFASQIVKKQK
jgi:hypothetical protein